MWWCLYFSFTHLLFCMPLFWFLDYMISRTNNKQANYSAFSRHYSSHYYPDFYSKPEVCNFFLNLNTVLLVVLVSSHFSSFKWWTSDVYHFTQISQTHEICPVVTWKVCFVEVFKCIEWSNNYRNIYLYNYLSTNVWVNIHIRF